MVHCSGEVVGLRDKVQCSCELGCARVMVQHSGKVWCLGVRWG